MTTLAAITSESIFVALFISMVLVICAWSFLSSNWDRNTPWQNTPAGGKTRNPNPYKETIQELTVILVVQLLVTYAIAAYLE